MTWHPILALVLLTGCRAAATPEEIAAATLFFPPVFKYVEEPRVDFSDAERLRALEECKRQGGDTLFEWIIDADGVVRRARSVRTWVDEIYHDVVLEHARRFEFSGSEQREMYRAFDYPLEYRFQSRFEWL
jgi:hypothetical protein